jgi:predicted MFS family arabinose efflux permease
VAGVLIKAVGAPIALVVDAVMLLASALILRRVRVREALPPPRRDRHFGRDLVEGLRFVARQRLLVALAVAVGVWQMCHHAALVVQILFATRKLGLSEQAVGLSYAGMGVGTILASVFGHRISRRAGPGPTLIAGFAVCGGGWTLLALAPVGPLGVAAFAAMLVLFGFGAVLVFINFLALRQAVTPAPLLGRMTSTMRWLTLVLAGPGALLGGWLGEQFGLRATLAFAGGTALLLAAAAWHVPVLRGVLALPTPDDEPKAGDAAIPAFADGR